MSDPQPRDPNAVRADAEPVDAAAPNEAQIDEAHSDDAHSDEADRAAHLDAARIRRTASLRRSLYRSRSYALIAAIACSAAAAQCAYLALRHVRSLGWGVRPMILIVLMLGAIVGSLFLARRAIALNRELTYSIEPDPTTTPDFSTLSDGSQRARNLDEVR